MLGKPSRRERKRLEERGVRADATVLEIAERGIGISGNAASSQLDRELALKVKLRVEPEGRPWFEVETRLRFPVMAVPGAGNRIVVVYDPEDPDNLMRDETAIANMPMAAGGGLRPDQIQSIEAARSMAQSGASPQEIIERVNAIRAAAGQPPAQVVGGAPAAAPDPLAQLEQLANLRDRGVLTEEEFAAQKARILGSQS
jgi:putative oligomerization/nucleic acid binding protein